MTFNPLLVGAIQLSGAGAAGGVAGYIPSLFNGGFSTAVDKWAFPSDTRSATTATTASGNGFTCFANSAVAGYKSGGYNQYWARIKKSYKMTMPSDTWSTLADVAAVVAYGNGNANSGVAGYLSGGQVTGGTYASDRMEKITFSSDAWSTMSTVLPYEYNINGGSMDNTGVACYIAGGRYKSGGSTFVTNKVIKWSVPSESVTTTTVLSASRAYKGGCSNNAVAGYNFGGMTNGDVVEKYAFPSDTRSTLTATVEDVYAVAGFSNSGVAGYSAGGYAATSVVSKIDFSNDTSATTTAISQTSYYTPGFSDQGVL